MSSTLLFLLFTTLSMTSIIISTPVTMGGLVLIQALLTSMMISSTVSSWFGMMLFIIYIGGLLIMFAYFIALGPNQYLLLMPAICHSLLLYTFFLLNLLYHPLQLPMSTMTSPTNPPIFTIFNATNLTTYLLLAMILFIALILAAKITERSEGPLRPFS